MYTSLIVLVVIVVVVIHNVCSRCLCSVVYIYCLYAVRRSIVRIQMFPLITLVSCS